MKIQKPHMAVRVLLGILSVILCLALFCTTVLTMVVADLKVLTGKDTLQSLITQLVFAAPKKNSPVYLFQSAGVGGVRLDEADTAQGESGGTQFIVDYLYDYLEQAMGDELNISKEDVGALLEESSVPEFVSDKMASMVSDIITGESTTVITKDEILDLVEENKELIEDVIGEELPEEVIEQIATKVEETNVADTVKDAVEVQLGLKPDPNQPEGPAGDEGVGGTQSGTTSSRPVLKENVIESVLTGKNTVEDVVTGGIPTLLVTLREITANTVLLTLLGVCLVLIVLLFAANYWKLYAALRGVGITLMVAALPFVAAMLAVEVVPALFMDPAMRIVAMVIELTGVVSLSTFGGGLVLLIGSIVWGSLCKRAQNKAIAEAVAVPVESAPAVAEEVPVAENTEA